MYNLWFGIGLYNGSKGKVVDFFNTTSEFPKIFQFTESVVVQFFQISDKLELFPPDVPCYIAIPTLRCKWTNTNSLSIFTRIKISLKFLLTFNV